MGRIVTGFSMSLDGFVAGPNDGVDRPLGEGGERLFAWYGAGDTEFRFPDGDYVVHVSQASAERLQDAIHAAGALVTGRKTFDITNGWNGHHTLDVPVLVVTHSIPQEWVQQWGATALFTFVTDGVESAIEQAQRIAGGKNVVLGSASIVKQCLKAGLLDEVSIDLVPVLLGGGVRLFEPVGAEPIDLEIVQVTEGTGVTHIQYALAR